MSDELPLVDDDVIVREPGKRPWFGRVTAVRPWPDHEADVVATRGAEGDNRLPETVFIKHLELYKGRHTSQDASRREEHEQRKQERHELLREKRRARRARRANPGEGWRAFFAHQASWDEEHIQPVTELVNEGMDPVSAYNEVKSYLADPEFRMQWIVDHAGDASDEGAPSPEAAYEVWSDAYLRACKDRVYGMKQNPSPDLSDEDQAAAEKYLEFHRYDAKHLDTVDIKIPEVVYRGGKATWVTYRSRKVDPSTLVRPKRPIDYIHEFDAGVQLYRTDAGEGRERTPVPDELRQVGALVKLGMCLGFEYKNDDGVIEAQSSRPLPELACSPDGKCLYVIQDRRRVMALIWGGALGVFARGIDG